MTRYFNDVLIAVNFVLSLAPSPFTAGMIASAMPAAIYSIAVAPDSSARNAFKALIIVNCPFRVVVCDANGFARRVPKVT